MTNQSNVPEVRRLSNLVEEINGTLVCFLSADRVVAPTYCLKEDEDYKKVGDIYHCTRCDMTFPGITSLTKHVSKDHLDIPRYKCSVCFEAFITLAPLIVHKMKAHNVDDRVKCRECNKIFNTEMQLKAHFKLLHKDGEVGQRNKRKDRLKNPRYTCSICIEKFFKPALLTVHRLEVHKIDDRFKCTACDKIFNDKNQLSKHIKYFHMHGDFGRRYKCEVCDYETFQSYSMRKHKIVHKTVRDFHCRFCKKSFKRRSTLNFHERIHTGDRRKVCAECGQAFVQKASLNYHMTKHHPDVKF